MRCGILFLSALLLLWPALLPDALACAPQTPAITLDHPRIDGPMTLRARDGTRYRLAGITPAASPQGEALEQHLAQALTGRERVDVIVTGEADRYHRLPVILTLQGEDVALTLLRKGLTRVEAASAPHPCRAALLRAETEAFLAGHHAVLAATDKEALAKAMDTITAVRGRVLSVRTVGRITYINFGRRDSGALTAIIRDRHRAALLAEGLDPEGLKGQDILVIGRLVSWRGPQIDIEKAENIRITATKTSQHTIK